MYSLVGGTEQSALKVKAEFATHLSSDLAEMLGAEFDTLHKLQKALLLSKHGCTFAM